MAKKKISRERQVILKKTKGVRIKTGTTLVHVASGSRLRDKQKIFEGLWQCLIEQDINSFKEILSAHVDAMSADKLSLRSKVSKRSIYRMLSPEGNPTLKNISQVLHALYS